MSEPCLGDETLARMVAGALDPEARAAALVHLERCDECRSTVAAAMQLADETRTIAGRYRLEGELGRGGMGMVYRAHDDVLDRVVAIKLLPAGSAADRRARAKLVRESKAMAKLRHPNVVAIHDAGHDGDQLYVAMEHIPGLTLRGWLGQRPRTEAEILAVFVKAARGLAAAHAVGVVHRDFKPDNVLVDDDGEPKVADFGLARTEAGETWEPRDDDHEPSHDDGLTRSGPGGGTPAYMPPEQLGGGDVDRRADVFSLCVSLWEALHGVRPFVESSIDARLAAIRRGELVDAPGRTIDVGLRRVLERGLAAEPSRRFESIDALLAALDARAVRRTRRRRLAAAAVGTVAVGCVAAAVVFARPEPCGPADDRLHAAWSPAAITRIQSVVLDGDDPIGAQVAWSRMRPAIEGAVAAYDHELVDACEARAEDPALASRVEECLTIERGALAFRLELAAQGDADAARAIELGANAAWCSELATEWIDHPIVDPRIATGVAETRAWVQIGRTDAARTRARETLVLAEAGGDAVSIARTRLELGRLETDPARASATLEQAAQEAGAEHVTAAIAWIFAGYYAEPEDAERCLAAAEAELVAIENPGVRGVVQMRAAVLDGEIRIARGDAEGTRVAFERALGFAREHAPHVLPDVLFLTTWAAWARGDLEFALTRQTELVRWHEHSFTPNRLTHARAMWNLADLQLEAGMLDEALATIVASHEVAGPRDDAEHHARRMLSEAEIRLHRGELDAADAVLVEVDALQRTIDAGLEDRGRLAALRGLALLLRGRPDAALAELEGAFAAGGTPVDLGMDTTDARAIWGEAMRRAGRAEAALAVIEPAVVRLRASHGPLRETARMALVSGWLLHAVQRDTEAAARFDEALVRLVDPCERAWAEIGRVAVGAAGVEPLDRAREVLGRHPDAHRIELAELEALTR